MGGEALMKWASIRLAADYVEIAYASPQVVLTSNFSMASLLYCEQMRI